MIRSALLNNAELFRMPRWHDDDYHPTLTHIGTLVLAFLILKRRAPGRVRFVVSVLLCHGPRGRVASVHRLRRSRGDIPGGNDGGIVFSAVRRSGNQTQDPTRMKDVYRGRGEPNLLNEVPPHLKELLTLHPKKLTLMKVKCSPMDHPVA